MLAGTVLALALVVHVYDNTGVGAADMEAALAAAHAILHDAGIAAIWRCDDGLPGQAGRAGQARQAGQDGQVGHVGVRQVGTDDDRLAVSEVIVRIVAAPPTSLPGSLGFSYIDLDRRSGTLATVFADRVKSLSAMAGSSSGQLLGRAIAHEIGHLLLGTTHHADRGLMRGVWTTIDLQKEQPWDWVLSRDDAAGMRRGLAARLRRPAQPAAVVARK